MDNARTKILGGLAENDSKERKDFYKNIGKWWF